MGVEVEDTGGGTVGDEQVQLVWDAVPDDLFPIKWVLECVSNEIGSVGRSENAYALNLHKLVLQVNAALLELVNQLISAELFKGEGTEQGYLSRYCTLR
jgi:hypothetical protein